MLNSLCSVKLARSREADIFWTDLTFLIQVIKTWEWVPGIKVKYGRDTSPPLLQSCLSVMFMVCLLTDKWKSNSQVCKLKVNSGVICQLTIQRNCLPQGGSSLTHTDTSCAGHAALQAKCCCKCLYCCFCHSACGSSQETRGGHGWSRDVTAPVCLCSWQEWGSWWDGQLPLQPIQSMSASLSGQPGIHCPAGVCITQHVPASGSCNLLPGFRNLGFSAVGS